MNRKLKLQELKRVTLDTYKTQKKLPIVVILDDIRSLNNIGSFFRTMDAFSLEKIYLCGITACPPHREIHKTALGATESVEWEYQKNVSDVVMHLKKSNVMVYAVEQTEKSISLERFFMSHSKIALIFGNEVNGVSQEAIDLADGSIEIPQFGTKHSLNVSVSAGVVLWHITNQLIQQ